MATDIELDDLAEKRRQRDAAGLPATSEDTAASATQARDGSVAAWAWASAGLLSLAALILLTCPHFLLFFSLSSEFSEHILTPLERFLSLHFSFFLASTAICLILYIPSDEVFETHTRRRDTLGHPLLGPLTGACVLSSFVSYNTRSVGPLSFGVFLLTGTIGLWGLWVLLFEGPPRISKKTGADKHTSAFLFGNKTAHSVQKKELKEAHKKS